MKSKDLRALSAAELDEKIDGFKQELFNLRWQSAIDREAVAYDDLGTATPLRIQQSSYALLGLMANYDINTRWSATLNLDNVTDEKSLTSLYWEQGYYGAPRGVTVSVGYRF